MEHPPHAQGIRAHLAQVGVVALKLCIAAALLAIFNGWARSPSQSINPQFFQNEDIAGITYNADLIGRGKLPYVDNYELKAPGSFFALHWIWKISGRSLQSIERFGTWWALVAALGVCVTGWLLFSSYASGLIAALIYCLCAPYIDSITVNYNAWMATPYIWCTAFFVAALRRRSLGLFVVAGIVGAIAGLTKRQGGFIVPALGMLLICARWIPVPSEWPHVRRRSLIAFAVGVALGFIPILTYYTLRGHLTDFFRGYFFLSSGWNYVAREESSWIKLTYIGHGLWGFVQFLLLPTLLAIASFAVTTARPSARLNLRGALLVVHFGASFAAASLGFRYYKSYYLQLLPVLCWLAAHPEGIVARWFQRSRWPRSHRGKVTQAIGALSALLMVLPAVLHDGDLLLSERRKRRGKPTFKGEALAISDFIARNSKPADSIWVWGRWAWPVYFHANRQAPTRFYKVLGVVTTSLDNTWKKPTSRTLYVERKPFSDLIANDLIENEPAFIVDAKNESRRGWTAIDKLLARRYLLYNRHYSAFRVYYRNDLKLRP